jgi:hypothetical protein
MKGPDPIEKRKKQPIENGYPDVEVEVIGDVPWRVAQARVICPRLRQRRSDKFYVIKGAGKVYGMAGAENVQAAVLLQFCREEQVTGLGRNC